MQYDLHNNIAQVAAINPQTLAQTVSPEGLVSSGIDLQFFSSAELSVFVGDIDEMGSSPVSDAKIQVRLEHSDNDSTYTDVTVTDVLGPSAVSGGFVSETTTDTEIIEVGYVGGKRYIRVSLIPTGLTNGGPVAAWVVKGNPRHAPQ